MPRREERSRNVSWGGAQSERCSGEHRTGESPTSTTPESHTFIDVEVAEDVQGDAELAKTLEEVCPVDIFAARDGGVEVIERNLDECILCEMCVRAAPPGGVRVVKLYDNGSALER